MSGELKRILAYKLINQWKLFWLIAISISVAMISSLAMREMTSGEAVSSMIQLSVRWSVPWLFLAFAASALQKLFPGDFSRWLLRNRKIFGLCFAAGMAWQLTFILWMVGLHTDYYVNEVYVLRDAIEGVGGYFFLIAMTVTSFKIGRRQLSTKQWQWLHRIGIYYLWAYAWSVYWYELYYYGQPDVIDHIYYWAGLGAWGLRAAAWAKKTNRAARTSVGAAA